MPPQRLNATLIIGALIRKLALLHTMFVVLADQSILKYVFQDLNSKISFPMIPLSQQYVTMAKPQH